MTRDQLEHAIRAACEVAEGTDFHATHGFYVHGVLIEAAT